VGVLVVEVLFIQLLQKVLELRDKGSLVGMVRQVLRMLLVEVEVLHK
jgi:hypothetical protein